MGCHFIGLCRLLSRVLQYFSKTSWHRYGFLMGNAETNKRPYWSQTYLSRNFWTLPSDLLLANNKGICWFGFFFFYFWNELQNCSTKNLHIPGAATEEVSTVLICLLFSISLLLPLYVQRFIRTGLVIFCENWFGISEWDIEKLLHCMGWNRHFQSINPLTLQTKIMEWD